MNDVGTGKRAGIVGGGGGGLIGSVHRVAAQEQPE